MIRGPTLLVLGVVFIAAHAAPRTAAAQVPERAGLSFVRAHEAAPPHALRVAGVLDDEALADALRSGLPLRLRYRVELWRDRWIDALVHTASWTTTLLYDPLDRVFIARDERDGTATLAARGGFDAIRTALHRDHALQPEGLRSGRYYFTAVLEVESLTLSDFEELERWLQGELQPAIAGERNVGSALGQGARRLVIRMLRLPARRFEGRSGSFAVP